MSHYNPQDFEHLNTENKSNTPPNIRDLWQTPETLFNKLDKEFNFTCDVAASELNKLCERYIDEEADALKCLWWGAVNWCNPPYSDIGPWVDKAAEQHKKGNTTVMLVPADTSVKWFKRAYDSCNGVWFISGRLSFINADSQQPVNGNNKGSVLLIWLANVPSTNFNVKLIDRSEFL